jgi:hypothetical protein
MNEAWGRPFYEVDKQGYIVAVYAVNSKIMYSVIVFCCSCCALHEAAAGSIYMTYL